MTATNNTLQKITYIGVMFLLIPLLILTGMILSPGLAPVTVIPMELMGGDGGRSVV